MVKISVSGYDDGEGPSNRTQKRQRVEEQAEEEEEGQQQGFGMGERPSGTQEAEIHNEGAEETVGSNGNTGPRIDIDRSLSVFITDPDVLDCCICFEPLSDPVFQCENGHIACSNCCARIRNKCPMCSMPIGYNRCRAIEKVLEAIKVSCLNAKYGCKEMVSYSKKSDHEKECIYIPCSCPHTGCNFVASSKELSLHFSCGHVGFQFTYDKFFTVFLNTDQKAIVLQEKNNATLFIVHNNLELLGNKVHISCIGPKSMAGFHYDVLARSQGSTLILQSVTKIIRGIAGVPSTGFLLVPSEFFHSGQLKLDIRIKSQH